MYACMCMCVCEHVCITLLLSALFKISERETLLIGVEEELEAVASIDLE